MFLYSQEDEYWVKKFKWSVRKSGYAGSTTCRAKTGYDLFHRLIMNAKEGEFVDHINRNKLDNRRENLRIVDKETNQLNSPYARPNSKTGKRGITLTRSGKYRVRLTFHKITYELGLYESLNEASKAYQVKKEELIGNV